MKNCIVSFEYDYIVKKLNSFGLNCHPTHFSNRVSRPIAYHSDVLYNKINEITALVSECQKDNYKLLFDNGIKVIPIENLQPGYKTECYLNFINTDKLIIRNPNTALSCDLFNNKREIKVRQGYTRCSTICVNDSTFITEDEGIYSALIKNNLNCLKINKGTVKLEGYDCGFIGGAAVMTDKHNLLFFGDIADLSQKNKITDFLKSNKVSVHFIENKPLIDIGSAFIF